MSPSNPPFDDLLKKAMDSEYDTIMDPVFRQIDLWVNSPSSSLQKALRELDQEASRLASEGKKMYPDNPVLRNTMLVAAETFSLVEGRLRKVGPKLEKSGRSFAGAAVTAKIYAGVTGEKLKDPLSRESTRYFARSIKRKTGVRIQGA